MKRFAGILTVIDAAGGKIEGRTVLQKLLYFASQRGLVEAEYFAHYYGPYSEEVNSALHSLVAADLVEEEAEMEPAMPYDWRRYTYKVAKDTRPLLKEIKMHSRKEFTAIRKLVKTCKEVAQLDSQTLSCAAKVHYILANEQRPMDVNDIKKEAGILGWNLTSNQMDSAADVLVKLGFAKHTE